MAIMESPCPLATMLGHVIYSIFSQSIIFHSFTTVLIEKWVHNPVQSKKSPPRTFPLELIGETSPTLEMAKLEECEPGTFLEEKSY